MDSPYVSTRQRLKQEGFAEGELCGVTSTRIHVDGILVNPCIDLDQRFIKNTDKNNSETKKYKYHYFIALVFLDMKKDFVDTAKRYKSWKQVKRDLGQLFFGLLNIGKGIFYTIITPALFLLALGLLLVGYIDNGATFFSNLLRLLLASTSFLALGITNAIRGATQILTAPLTLLRALGRGLATAWLGWKPFQEGDSTKQQLAAGITLIKQKLTDMQSKVDTVVIMEQLYNKFCKDHDEASDPLLMKALKDTRSAFYSNISKPNTEDPRKSAFKFFALLEKPLPKNATEVQVNARVREIEASNS
jgi:hypothetical protein